MVFIRAAGSKPLAYNKKTDEKHAPFRAIWIVQ